jgi:DNA transposition AAA+ family ATPase
VKPTFVETANYKAFLDGLVALNARGSDECRLVVVDGQPGLGKTTILYRWAALESCVFVRAKTDWDPKWMLSEILENMKLTPPVGHEARFRACVAGLVDRLKAAEVSGRQFAIVVDEADHVSRKAVLIDTLRDLADLVAVPVILVGMGKIRDNLTKYPQTASRISRYIRFEPATLDGVRQFLTEKCEVAVAPDMADFVHRATGGFNREILEAIKSIEKFGLRNPPGEGGLTIRDMAGQHLINDRRSGQPIMVPVR